MKQSESLKVTPRGERELVITRDFDAPRAVVFEAWTKPDLVRQWLLGPPGWTMPVCEIDARPGGKYRYVWRKESAKDEMGLRGVFREVKAPERIVHTESFDQKWYPGEAVITTVFAEQAGRTTVTMTLQYESKEARDAVLKSGMETGVNASYDRLDELLESSLARRGSR